MSYEGERRPSSDTLVDLHVSIVPVEHWVERLNYASCKVISDTFSAGFITVSPDTHVARLRNEIQDQLGQTNFPTEYVFLKHVGRCLALVRQNQETKLKVKSFLPPHSVVPEIFILPGHPNMYKYSVLPPINAMHQDLHSDENNDSDAPEKVVLPNIKRRKQLNSLSLNENSLDNEVPHQISNTKKPQRQHKNPSLEAQKRHLSGKSSYNSSPLTPKTRKSSNSLYDDNPSLSPETVNTTTKLRNYPSTIGKPQPTKAKSVLKEGPKQQHVDYKRPLESNSAVSSIENHKNGEGFPSSPFQTDNKRYMYSTNDDSGYVDIEQSGSEASTPFVQPPRRNSLPFPKNMDSNPNPEGLDEDSDKRYSPGSKRRSKPLKKPLSIEPPEEVEKHTPSPITIPMFKKPPVERRDLIDSSQSSIRNSGAPGQKSVAGQSKIKAETVEKNTKGSEKGVKQKANAMKHTENGPKQINKLQKNSEKRPDSSSREKLWAELQKARGERKVAENKRQELVKQAKMTTSKMNQKRTSVSAEYKKLYPRLKSGKQKTDSSPKEKCDVPGCYYVFQTSADKKRHFGLVHRSRITRDSGTNLSANSWTRSVILQSSNEKLKSAVSVRRKSGFGSTIRDQRRLSVRRVTFSETRNTAGAITPSTGIMNGLPYSEKWLYNFKSYSVRNSVLFSMNQGFGPKLRKK